MRPDIKAALRIALWRASPIGVTSKEVEAMVEHLFGHDGLYSHGLAVVDSDVIASMFASEFPEITEQVALSRSYSALSSTRHGFTRVVRR